jgi:hypothetical protein
MFLFFDTLRQQPSFYRIRGVSPGQPKGNHPFILYGYCVYPKYSILLGSSLSFVSRFFKPYAREDVF